MIDIVRFQSEGAIVDGGDASSSFDSTLDGGDAFTVYSDVPQWFASIGGTVIELVSVFTTLNGSTIPLLLTQYAGGRTTQHIVHEIIGRSDPDVTFAPTQTRAGELTLLYESLELVGQARDLLALPGPITLTQKDMPALSMTFVVPGGELTIAPDQEDPSLWTITVPFREVVA